MTEQFDVCVIGGGVVGCAVARALSYYQLSVCVVEKEEDIASGTTKANSGIVHAGYDAKPGSVKARMNVRGAALVRQLSQTLDFPYRQNGSLVVCFNAADLPALQELYERGLQNGVQDLRLLNAEEVRALEPALSAAAAGALYAPTAGVVCPFGMTQAFAENAAANGAVFRFLAPVTALAADETGYMVTTPGTTLHARAVVNAAGVYADRIHAMVSRIPMHITPRKGEYMLMDREVGDLVTRTIFQLPGKQGKGVLVAPTVHGNLLVGPNAQDEPDKENTATTASGTADVRQKALRSVPDLPWNKVITGFAGLRAHEDGDDFIVGEAPDAPGFFNAAGIESPGLTAAPAIGEWLAGQVAARLGAAPKANPITTRRGIPRVAELPPAERSKLIAQNPAYGVIVCRCESISEGEIVDAIHRTPGAVSMDGIKRRVRQGMGRCQAGFCTPAAMAILARELAIPVTRVTKNRPGSELIKE